MNENFNFLTTICGIFACGNEDALKLVDMLAVYANTRECSLKIYYKSMSTLNSPSNKGEIAEESGEFLLELGYMEFDLIYNNSDKDMIKKLIFNKYQDHVGQSLFSTKVY